LQLLTDLRAQPEAILLVRSGRTLEELLRDLPESVEFVPDPRPSLVTVGWVRPRAGPAGVLFARR
jgi:hypothetical protein